MHPSVYVCAAQNVRPSKFDSETVEIHSNPQNIQIVVLELTGRDEVVSDCGCIPTREAAHNGAHKACEAFVKPIVPTLGPATEIRGKVSDATGFEQPWRLVISG